MRWKSHFAIIIFKNSRSTQSYALVRSSFSVIDCHVLVLRCLIQWKAFVPSIMLFEMDLEAKNAPCLEPIVFGSTCLILSKRILDKILYVTLQRVIGRKSAGVDRFLIFGIRVSRVWLRSCMSDWLTKNFRLIGWFVGAIIVNYFWKKGPGIHPGQVLLTLPLRTHVFNLFIYNCVFQLLCIVVWDGSNYNIRYVLKFEMLRWKCLGREKSWKMWG